MQQPLSSGKVSQKLWPVLGLPVLWAEEMVQGRDGDGDSDNDGERLWTGAVEIGEH